MVVNKNNLENVKCDLEFLKEIKERLLKGEADVTQREYAYNLIDDWIQELEESLTIN